MKIILVEDDHNQSSFVVEGLAREFGGQVRVIQTELEFRRRLVEIAADPPDIFVIDVWLSWTVPDPDMTLPPEDAKDDKVAGLRCQGLLAGLTATREVPVILYGFLDKSHYKLALMNLPPTARYLVKAAELTPLFQEIRLLTG